MDIKTWLGEDNKLGIDIWERKYQHNNETLDEWFDRVSGGNSKLRKLIVDKKFLFGGRTLTNRGIKDSGNYFNCFSAGFVPDDYSGIMDMLKEVGITFKYQGGQGVSFSKLRPKGTNVGEHYQSDGIVPFIEMFNEVTKGTSQGGSRKGALMVSLDARHKEAEDFIKLKTDVNAITKANLSLEIDDKFMQAVEDYYKYGVVITLHESRYYSGHLVEYDVIPINLYKLMMEVVWDYGEPGCMFVNRFRNYNFMEYCDDYMVETSNPCGEQPLKAKTSCNLGSLNLYKFVQDPFTDHAKFNHFDFVNAVEIASNALDDIIDENMSRLPEYMHEYIQNAKDYRNIGLGVFGYADMLMALGLKYGSKDAILLSDEIFDEMMYCSMIYNTLRAKSKGAFPKCNKPEIKRSEIFRNHECCCGNDFHSFYNKHGFRNCSLLSIAPTGTIATMFGMSGGIEPEFSLASYVRRTDNLDDQYELKETKVVQDYRKISGNTEGELPDYFVSSADIPWKNRIDTQAIIQNHIDTAISSTVNLPKETTKEEVEELYLYAWQKGLKGVTIFRDGCKRLGILLTNNDSDESGQDDEDIISNNEDNKIYDADDLPRGYIIDAADDDSAIILMRNLMTGCGHLYIAAKFDPVTGDLLEIFPNKGSSGGCICTMTGLTRQTSTSARAGVPIEAIIDQFKSCPPCPSYAVRSAKYHDTAKGSSCPVAIGYALEDMHKVVMERIHSEADDEGENTVTDETVKIVHVDKEQQKTDQEWIDSGRCPICHDVLVHEGGCLSCKSCGFSKCD